MLSQFQIWKHPSRIRMCRLYSSKSHWFQDLIKRRTLDKHHQSAYHLVEKQRTRYNSKRSTIYPTLEHLLICIRKHQEDKAHHIHLVEQFRIHEKKRANNFIEPLLFHSILSLYFIMTSRFPHEIITIQKDHLSSIMNKLGITDPPSTIAQADMASQLDIHTLHQNVESMSVLHLSINLIETLFPEYTLSTDIIPWIKTIVASNITESCRSLTSLLNIPACVLTDIVLRTPMNKGEYYLQLQIWNDFQAEIAIAYHKLSKHLKACLSSLIYYGVEYDSNKLPDLLATTFHYYNTSAQKYGYKHTNFLTKPYLNRLLWEALYNNIRNSHTKVPLTAANITKSQEYILKQLSILHPGEKSLSNLELRGYMGIILAIHKLSLEKAEKLMKLAEHEFDPLSAKLELSEHIAYHFTKITLSKTPEQLLFDFNKAADNYSHSSLVWLAFIVKLDEFGLLNESRSLKIAKQLVSKQERILITKDIMLRLLKPMNTLTSIEKLIKILEESKIETLSVAHKSSILPKYLRLLYRNFNAELPPSFIPRKMLTDIKSDYSMIEYCRKVYDSIEYKTSSLVGAMLTGECNVRPEAIYEIYEKELKRNKLNPNEECLVALLNASATTNSEGACMTWGEMYAPQLAIHEFRKHVMTKSFQDGELNDTTKIFPTDYLWLTYIDVLGKYGYVSELSTILEWWVSIEFIPNANTLKELLLALPPEFGQRHLQHVESVSLSNVRLLDAAEGREEGVQPTDMHSISTNDWPWPTFQDLEEARRERVMNSRPVGRI